MISERDFIRLETPAGLLKIAAVRDGDKDKFKNSITNNERRKAAFAAELAFSYALQIPVAGDTETHYDFVVNGHRADLKTMERSYRPNDRRLPSLEWECNVLKPNFDYQTNLDFYFFADTNRDGSVLIFTGYIAKDEFIEKAVLHKKGTLKNAAAREPYWTEDTYSIEIRHLKPYGEFISAAIKNTYLKGITQ